MFEKGKLIIVSLKEAEYNKIKIESICKYIGSTVWNIAMLLFLLISKRNQVENVRTYILITVYIFHWSRRGLKNTNYISPKHYKNPQTKTIYKH